MKSTLKNNALFTPSLKIVAAAALAGFLSLPGALGQTLTTYYETGFESPTYTAGALSGQQGWSVSSIGTVAGTVGTIVPPEGTQMLETTRLVSGDASTFANSFAGYGAGVRGDENEQFVFSFKLAADAHSNAAMGLSIGNSARGTSGAWAGFRNTGTAVDPALGFYFKDGNDWTRLGSNTVALNEFYTFYLTVDIATETFGLKVYNSIGNLQGSVSGIDFYFTSGNTTMKTSDRDYIWFNRVYGQIDQIGATKFYVDDILVQQIPEPGAFVLALFGTAIVFLRRRRK